MLDADYADKRCFYSSLAFHFHQFVHSVAAVAEFAQPTQFLPDLSRKLVWRLYRVNALGPARKRSASQARILIQRSEFEPFFERLHRAFEHLRRYATCWFWSDGALLLIKYCLPLMLRGKLIRLSSLKLKLNNKSSSCQTRQPA